MRVVRRITTCKLTFNLLLIFTNFNYARNKEVIKVNLNLLTLAGVVDVSVVLICLILLTFLLQQHNGVVVVESFVILYVQQQQRLSLLNYNRQLQHHQVKLSSKDCDNHNNHKQDQQDQQSDDHIQSVRLNKVFIDHYSRRQADEIIRNQRVAINGIIINDNNIGCKVIPYHDVITVDNIPYINWEQRLGYYQRQTEQTQQQMQQNIQQQHQDEYKIQPATISPTTISTATTTTTKQLPTKELYQILETSWCDM